MSVDLTDARSLRRRHPGDRTLIYLDQSALSELVRNDERELTNVPKQSAPPAVNGGLRAAMMVAMPDLLTCVRCGRWAKWEATADSRDVICPNCHLTRPELIGPPEEEEGERPVQ